MARFYLRTPILYPRPMVISRGGAKLRRWHGTSFAAKLESRGRARGERQVSFRGGGILKNFKANSRNSQLTGRLEEGRGSSKIVDKIRNGCIYTGAG